MSKIIINTKNSKTSSLKSSPAKSGTGKPSSKTTLTKSVSDSYEEFLSKSHQLVKRLGLESIDLISILLQFSISEEADNKLIKPQTISKILKELNRILPRQFSSYPITGSNIILLTDSLMSVFFAEKITAYIKSICDDKFSFNVKKISLSTSSSITLNSISNSKSANKNSEQQTEEIINHCLKQLTTPVATKSTSVVG